MCYIPLRLGSYFTIAVWSSCDFIPLQEQWHPSARETCTLNTDRVTACKPQVREINNVGVCISLVSPLFSQTTR